MANRDQGPLRTLGMIGGLGFQLGLTVLLGALGGYYLDKRWGTGPWLLLVGTLLGTGAGFYEIIRALNMFQGKNNGGTG
ncbi:MAG: AtpZ/AtpI family protein [Armatimonadota bacterium]